MEPWSSHGTQGLSLSPKQAEHLGRLGWVLSPPQEATGSGTHPCKDTWLPRAMHAQPANLIHMYLIRDEFKILLVIQGNSCLCGTPADQEPGGCAPHAMQLDLSEHPTQSYLQDSKSSCGDATACCPAGQGWEGGVLVPGLPSAQRLQRRRPETVGSRCAWSQMRPIPAGRGPPTCRKALCCRPRGSTKAEKSGQLSVWGAPMGRARSP